MVDCCEGHEINLLLVIGDHGTNTLSCVWLDENSIFDVLHELESGGCPVCQRLVKIGE